MRTIDFITFPDFTGIRCNMMPIVQGDPDSLPEEYSMYSDIVEKYMIEPGEIGWLTVHESEVEKGTTQRGYNSAGILRNIHIEVGRRDNQPLQWGGGWGGGVTTTLKPDTQVLISNSIDDTCRVWDKKEYRPTPDGDLSAYIQDYPEETGTLLKAGELVQIDILTPHECVAQSQTAKRQFFRLVGQGVSGKEHYWTTNPKIAV